VRRAGRQYWETAGSATGRTRERCWAHRLTAKIKGPQGACNALIVPIFAVPPGTK